MAGGGESGLDVCGATSIVTPRGAGELGRHRSNGRFHQAGPVIDVLQDVGQAWDGESRGRNGPATRKPGENRVIGAVEQARK